MENEIAKFNIPGVGEVFLIEGIKEKLINELIKFSATDPLVKKDTSDPKRFADRASYDKWLEKGRTIYTLVDESGSKLLGFFWLGYRPFTKENGSLANAGEYNITIADRIYGEARGKGMFKIVLAKILDDYIASEEYVLHAAQNQGNFWIETSENNYPNLKTYMNLGFKLAAHSPEKGKVQLVAYDNDILKCVAEGGCRPSSGEEKAKFVKEVNRKIVVLPGY